MFWRNKEKKNCEYNSPFALLLHQSQVTLELETSATKGKLSITMQRSPETDGNQYEIISKDGPQTFDLKAASVETQSGNANDKTKDAEKTTRFHPVEMDYDKGAGKIIANGKEDLPKGEEVPKGACPIPEVVYNSLEMQQQIGLLRRLMCAMAVLLLVVFLTAAASLVLAVATTIAKTLSSNHANSSQGMVVSLTRK